MIQILMSDIRRPSLGVTVPGGWYCKIPSVVLDPDEEEVYIRYLMNSRGMPANIAEVEVRERMQNIFNKGWSIHMRETIANRAAEYKQIFGTLEGFAPELLQSAYMPGENTGRAGKPVVRKMLLLMGKEAGMEPGDGYADN